MDLAAFKRLMNDTPLRSIFQAALMVANEDGRTLEELAKALGTTKSTVHRWIQKARDRRIRNPRVHLIYKALFDQLTRHSRDSEHAHKPGELATCLDCSWASPALARILARDTRPDPKPEPSRRYRPGKLKGGRGK